MVRTMTRTLVVLAVTLLGVSAFLQGEQREFVTRGEVLSVSVEDRTLTMREIAGAAGELPTGHDAIRSRQTVQGDRRHQGDGSSRAIHRARPDSPRSPRDHPLRARFGEERGEERLGDLAGD